MILETVKAQIEAEILTDEVQIKEILRDPSVVNHEKNIPYTIHEILHHLAVHKVALVELNKIIENEER